MLFHNNSFIRHLLDEKVKVRKQTGPSARLVQRSSTFYLYCTEKIQCFYFEKIPKNTIMSSKEFLPGEKIPRHVGLNSAIECLIGRRNRT